MSDNQHNKDQAMSDGSKKDTAPPSHDKKDAKGKKDPKASQEEELVRISMIPK